MGFRSTKNKSQSDIERSIQKAVSGKYKFVLLPCNSIYDFSFQEWIDQILKADLTPLIQVNSKSLNPMLFKSIEELSKKGCTFNFLIHGGSPDLKINLVELESLKLKRFYSIVYNKALHLQEIVNALPDSINQELKVFLPFKEKLFDGNFSCHQLNKRLQKISLTHPQLKLKPIEGLDQFDPRISPDLELEPAMGPLLSNSISLGHQIKFSVIVPTYNNQNYIQNNIRHLSLQTLPREQFEIILINDGSSDSTGEKIQESLSQLSDYNYKYFYLPRPRKRFMGDAQFRAGIARNLGVKWASGEYVSFLDADMITPRDYLKNLLDELSRSDVIQTERHYLKSAVSTNTTNYEDMDSERDTFIPEKGYWHDFYQSGEDWNRMDAGWKYVCTYSLTLSRELFHQIGWFRKTYMFYGFEDTDLGYRLFNQNKKFKLSKMKIYHLCQNDERSEYSNSDYLRQALLSKTAKIFYRNYLDSHIFERLKFLINDGPGIEDFISIFQASKK